jgi:hypothetical protein
VKGAFKWFVLQLVCALLLTLFAETNARNGDYPAALSRSLAAIGAYMLAAVNFYLAMTEARTEKENEKCHPAN